MTVAICYRSHSKRKHSTSQFTKEEAGAHDWKVRGRIQIQASDCKARFRNQRERWEVKNLNIIRQYVLVDFEKTIEFFF